MEKNNSIKNSFLDFEKELKKAKIKSGTLFFTKEIKYFWVLKVTNGITISLIPDDDMHIRKEYFKLSVVNDMSEAPNAAYRRVYKNTPMLFIGFLETDVAIKIRLPNKSSKDENRFFIINKQNYNSFYDDLCEWNKSENYKNLVDELVENKFKFKILQFLCEDQILWWSHLNLNKGINSLKEGLTSELIIDEPE